MSNVGTTATISPAEAAHTDLPQIEHIKETDMDNALSLFERMANSVVSASKLMPVVQGLMKDVDSLKKDIDHVREMNSRLDEMLTATRKERNELLSELNGVRTELNGAKQTNEGLHTEVNLANERITRLLNDVERERHERNGWMEAALKADADLQAANDKLAKFQELFHTLFPPTPAPETPVQLPNWNMVKGAGHEPDKKIDPIPSAFADGPTPSAEPQPALQTETAKPLTEAETAHFAEHGQLPKAEPEAKPEPVAPAEPDHWTGHRSSW